MADWGSPVSGAAFVSGFGSPLVVPSATANVKGAWYDVGILGSSGNITLGVSWYQSYTTHRTMLFDFAIGPAGSEQIFLTDLACAFSAVGTNASRAHVGFITLPITLPKGSQIRARAQSSYASNAGGYLTVSSYNAPSPWLGSEITTYGADTSVSAGTTLTADNASFVFGSWGQITASCDRMDCFFVAVFPRTTQTSYSEQDGWWELAVGAAGDEEPIATGNVQAQSSTRLTQPQLFGPFFQQVKQGQRLSGRLQRQNTTNQRTLDMIVYGVK